MQEHSATTTSQVVLTMSRRHILRIAAGATGGAVLLSAPGRALAHTATPVEGLTGPFVRKNAHSPEAGTVLEAYARAVTVMRERDDLDPTSWVFQARIHGAPGDVPVPPGVHWNQCPHGDKFFLPWHRMYLYWFERIVRKASGDSTFALPYWNYANADQQVLPEPFRLPAEEANALYVPARNPVVNAGDLPQIPLGPPPGQILVTLAEIAIRAFELLTEDPFDMSSALESLPHDLVHGWVGGRFLTGVPGWMDSTRTAALDPIFWLHHANIDRLWKRWLDLGGSRGYPADDPEWMDQVFHFYDEDGNVVEMSGKDVLDTATQLGYEYDDDPAEPPVTASPVAVATPASPGTAERGVSSRQAEASPAAERAAEGPFEVGAEGTLVSFAAPESAPGARSADAPAPPARVNLKGITGSGVPAVMYLVFINLPADQPPDPASPYFVGAVGLFSLQPWDLDPDHHDHAAGTQSIDISRAVEELQAMDEWTGEVVVTLVPVDLAPEPITGVDDTISAASPQASPAADAADAPWIVIEGISISG